MRILVTGGDGFIGTHLVNKLKALGNEVFIIDNHTTSFVSTDIDRDVCDYQQVVGVVNNVDFVFHLAATVGVSFVKENQESCLRDIIGTMNIVDACSDAGISMIYTSSSEIYGESYNFHMFPFYEENERIVYPISKLACELCIRSSKKLDWRIARLFNTIGPGQVDTYGMVVPSFINSALHNESLIVHGNGEQIRWFAHVEDVVDQLIYLINTPYGTIEDVGDLMETSILNLAKLIISITDSNSTIKFVDKPFGDTYGDLYRVKPKVNRSNRKLESVLEEIIEWWKSEKLLS